MTKRSFGELELEILQILKSGKKMTVKDVHQKLGQENKYNTIMTVMTRLAKKGVLSRERVGLQYEYWMPSPEPKMPSFLNQLKRKFFGAKTGEMVNFLLESADDISEEDLASMENMIKKARSDLNEKK